MRWLHKLEYKYGRYYIPNLMMVISAGMVLVYLLDLFFSAGGVSVSNMLSLDSRVFTSGQVWRLITFVFIPPATSPFMILINIYIYYIMGQMLESVWGGFKLNLYYLCGIVGAWLAMLSTWLLFGYGYGSNYYLNLSLLLAITILSPDTEFRLFFLIPVKAKWLGIGYAVLLAIPLLQTFIFGSFVYGMMDLINLVFSLLNLAIFFGPTLINSIKEQRRIAQNRRNWRNNNW